MFGYVACILSSLALVPMSMVLAVQGSWLALTYFAAAAVACLYHWHRERKFVRLDHGLAWVCIACNLWLAVHTVHWSFPVFATFCILLAVDRYYAAHGGDELDYLHNHTLWHLWCGMGGIFLALGYQ